jgi:hypothetical protein
MLANRPGDSQRPSSPKFANTRIAVKLSFRATSSADDSKGNFRKRYFVRVFLTLAAIRKNSFLTATPHCDVKASSRCPSANRQHKCEHRTG